jgi:pseudouridine kinase
MPDQSAVPPSGMGDRPRVTVFGAVAMDVRLHARATLVPGSSNPVTARETPGGVGRNMALGLAGLGASVRLFSRVGDDAAGTALLADLAAGGIDTRHVGRTADHATARYWAVLEASGELAMGLADMAVLETLEPASLAPAAAAPADAWLIEANLPEPCIGWLLARPDRPRLVAADSVSVAKAGRLRAHLAGLDLLFTNRAEAAVLAGGPAVEPLLESGVGAVVMGEGVQGLLVLEAHGAHRLDALPVVARDVTGAGDALAAATLFARLRGFALPLAARVGRLAAATIISDNVAQATHYSSADLRFMAQRFDRDLDAQLARLFS